MQLSTRTEASDNPFPGFKEVLTHRPLYSLIEELDGVEIRHYRERLAAQTPSGAPEDERAVDAAFQKLSGFFCGENSLRPGLYETKAATQDGIVIPFEVPWTQQFTSKGWMMRFWLPTTLNTFTAPIPRRPEISIVRLAPHAYATTRASGASRQEALKAALAKIRHELEPTNWHIVGSAEIWSYAESPTAELTDVELSLEVAHLSEK